MLPTERAKKYYIGPFSRYHRIATPTLHQIIRRLCACERLCRNPIEEIVMIVGIIRFSVLSPRGWALSRSENPEGFLFSPNRLSVHFGIFEALTLPFMKAEGGCFLLLISTLLPEMWKQRLFDGISGCENIHVRTVSPDENMGDVAKKFLSVMHAQSPNEKRIITYRLDDDDGLALGVTETLLKRQKCGAKIITHRNGFYICWNEGLKIAEVDYESNAQGIAFISNSPQKHITLFGGHANLTRHYDSLVLNDRGSWLRTIHSASDSFRDRPVKWLPLEDEQLEFVLKRFPYIRLKDLEVGLAAAHMSGGTPASQKNSVQPKNLIQPREMPTTLWKNALKAIVQKTRS